MKFLSKLGGKTNLSALTWYKQIKKQNLLHQRVKPIAEG